MRSVKDRSTDSFPIEPSLRMYASFCKLRDNRLFHVGQPSGSWLCIALPLLQHWFDRLQPNVELVAYPDFLDCRLRIRKLRRLPAGIFGYRQHPRESANHGGLAKYERRFKLRI